MYKIKVIETDYILKSFDIMVIWRFIISNSEYSYILIIGFNEVSVDDFLKTFLHETKKWREYYDLYKVLKPKSKKIIEIYGKNIPKH